MADNHVALMSLAGGVSLYDLSVLTRRTEDEVKAALSSVKPVSGGNARTYVYDLALALPAIYATEAMSTERIAAALKRMKPQELPPALQKEFWSAQKVKLQYLEEVGDLWRTHRVQRLVADLLKVMRQAITLMEDNVDQQSSLSVRQREIVRTIADSVLVETQIQAREAFKDWGGPDDREDQDPALGMGATEEAE